MNSLNYWKHSHILLDIIQHKFADAAVDLHRVQLLGGLSKSAQDYGKEVD